MIHEPKEKKAIKIPVESDEEVRDGTAADDAPEAKEEQGVESECTDQLLRLQAEFLNYKRRVEKEKDEIGTISKGRLMQSILPVVDDFERFIDHHENDETVPVESVRLIYQKLIKTLRDEGLESLEAQGEDFDPEIHEAVGVEQVGPARDGKVLEQWQKGYRFKDRMIRPSRVKVGRHLSGIQ